MYAPPPPYAVLNEERRNGSLRPPPYRSNVPQYNIAKPKKRGSCCFRCICCCYSFLVILVFLLAGLFFYFYVVYQPKIPSYAVDKVGVNNFQISKDFSLTTEFFVIVKADNPNTAIGINYGKGSSVNVIYSDAKLCSGKFPAFYQGHKNITMIKVTLVGKTTFGSGLQEALMDDENSRHVPLKINVMVPIGVVVGQIPFRQIDVIANCSVVVDSLSTGKTPSILSKECTKTWRVSF